MVDYRFSSEDVSCFPCDALVIWATKDESTHSGAYEAVNSALDGVLSASATEEDFGFGVGETMLVRSLGRLPAARIVLCGLGKASEVRSGTFTKAVATAIRRLQRLRVKNIAISMPEVDSLESQEMVRSVVLGVGYGSYEHTRLKRENVKPNTLESITMLLPIAVEHQSTLPPLAGEGQGGVSPSQAAIDRAVMLSDCVCRARDLANEPSNVVTPEYLVGIAREIADEFEMHLEVKDREGIESAGMNLLAAVARGSSVEPRFIDLRYTSPGASKTIALVGKGITFDTGGYSLKSQDHMFGMKDDMSGAAAVLMTMRAVGLAKPDVNVIALIPATENSIGSRAIHPGDVFESLGGKTVEVNNTDAEGRLVIADAIAYARSLKADEIIDLATLTGACAVALGHSISGLFCNNQDLAARLLAAGEKAIEPLWQLPLHTDYKSELRSTTADLKNSGGRYGGAINGALFIESFVGDVPWAHIDLSAATSDKDTPLARKGSTGAGTGILIEYLLG